VAPDAGLEFLLPPAAARATRCPATAPATTFLSTAC